MKGIIWDFDGVIIESDSIREKGFRFALREFEENEIEKLIDFHKVNGGMSRYAKFAYFFEQIHRSDNIPDLGYYLREFSSVMASEMFSKELLNSSVIEFIKGWSGPQFIASGSDESELRNLCEYFDLTDSFVGIYGSPKPKDLIIADIIKDCALDDFVLIGDSINDYEAAEANGIDFIGFSKDVSLLKLSTVCFSELKSYC